MTLSLHDRDRFENRHIGPDAAETAEMLAVLGVADLDTLVRQVVPGSIIDTQALPLPAALTETAATAALRGFASGNKVLKSFIGQGYYGTVTPPVIRRNILENPAWYTAYTPYQPEISQGRLEAILNFQTMVAELTGLDMANASLLDEGTAAAEAMTVAHRSSKTKSDRFFVSADIHPQTLAVVMTRAEPLGIEVVTGDLGAGLDAALAGGLFGALLQYPGTDGHVIDLAPAIAKLKAAGVLVTVAADPLALVLLTPPGELGADMAVGTTQRFGVPMAFGGPHAGYFACKDELKRVIPGRIVGVSIDAKGRRAYRLSLQTREQHIRREKATSNICTAQVLLAVISAMYATYHGPEGLKRIALGVHSHAAVLAAGLRKLGVKVLGDAFFDTVLIEAGDKAGEIMTRTCRAGYNLRNFGDGRLAIAFDETANASDIDALWEAITGTRAGFTADELAASTDVAIPAALARKGACVSHPIFSQFHSETQLLRYMRKLADKDLALDRTMIPLGSCTMKLNATTEMEPITWAEFANLHPFAPADQVAGILALTHSLENQLRAATGFDAVSLQPNSGAQGEYAGLLAIRGWHRSQGNEGRTVCLIPSSAHGTNPASAALAGMSVVVVGCDENGNVDVADLKAKAEQHKDKLAALMVTYPSTHGVFEEAIKEICEIVHANGGQVYMDGANFNALVGVARPAAIGADVMHMNLHKTFCIPHGGGGPGVGPIGVKSHLAPFLPGAGAVGAVSAAPFGSAGILAISWAYIAMMGAEGLKRATAMAILNANYIAERLKDHYPVLYKGRSGRVAHECILDTRPLKDEAGISVDDIAKRLMDFGFHAPTMSFPVAGTLMVEPTESEDKGEIDRFIDAMIAIREEIRAVASGALDANDNPLKNSPHTAADLLADTWQHSYSREQAAYPAGVARDAKYWPAVGRIDNVYGDRNLVCSCPPIEAYAAE
ncbi:aminomethyl-transferring glycine dehydrogenase [Radicibacter daui]|uniref:aminomethyl-transferring glycine dehydrogenase n=1 Tax=Radicibacter daui TaxID=3064829 RepID=UPI0040469B23